MASLLLKVGVGSLGITICAGTCYLTAISYAPAPKYEVSDSDRAKRFEDIAGTYLNDTKNQEFYLGIRKMRRNMVKEAKGDVLEVGAGTGTMVGLYPASDAAVDVFTKLRQEPNVQFLENSSSSSTQQQESKSTTKSSSSSSSSKTENVNPFEKKMIEDSMKMHEERTATGDGVRSITMGDRAAGMLNELETKIETRLGYKPHRIANSELDSWDAGRVFAPSPATDRDSLPAGETATGTNEKHPLYQTSQFSAESIPFPDNSFDTVVDIFGLCSYDDPVRALTEMSRVCKPDGEILLLEHGRGTWNRVNMQLDKWAPRHAKSWGCWWNRDLRRMLRLAGLTTKVTKREEKHFGTTQRVTCTPNKKWTTTQIVQ